MKVLIIEDESCWPTPSGQFWSARGLKRSASTTARPELNMRSWEFMTC